MLEFLARLLFPRSTTPLSERVAPPPAGAPFHPAAPRPVNGRGRRVDRRTRYVQTHARQLAERFSKDGGQGIQLDEQEYNWLIIPRYPMPERWTQRWTKLLILFPAGYPDTPPTGFYLSIPARLKRGGNDAHLLRRGGYYAEAPDLSADGWFWYCVHAQVEGAGGWQPAADPSAPDNLFTFLNMAREALTTNE
jgi:hypothetical protein